MPLWSILLFVLVFIWLALYCILDPQRLHSSKQLIEKAKLTAFEAETGRKKVIIITGSTNGVGLYAARELALAGWHVILANRSKERNNNLVTSILKQYPKAAVTPLTCDLSDLESVVSFADEFKKLKLPLDVLVCNAGINAYGQTEFKKTRQNLEPTFATNHVGHALLVKLLLPSLQKTKNSRIVITASDVHDPKNKLVWGPKPFLDFDNLNGEKRPYDGFYIYKQSKICNILYTYELTRKLQEKKNGFPTVNTFTPGFIPTTGLAGANRGKFLIVLLMDYVLGCLHITKSIADGGDQIVFLACHPSLANTTGKYFVYFKDVPSSDESYDQTKAEKLWDITEDIIRPYLKNVK